MNKDKEKFFDGHADSPWAAPDYNEKDMEKIDWLLEKINFRPGLAVLEPGCGTGRLTRILAERSGPDGPVSAMDISRAMIDNARRRLAGFGNITLAAAAIEEMDLPQNSFDLILCFNVFPHFDDKMGVLKKFRGLIKESGNLVIFHLEPSSFINDLHRKAGTVVEKDLIPLKHELEAMLAGTGFQLTEFMDTDRFLAMARPVRI